MKVWDIEEGRLLHSLEGQIAPVQQMMLSRAFDHLVISSGSQLTIWHFDSGTKIAQFTTDGTITVCKQADDGTIIVGDGLG